MSGTSLPRSGSPADARPHGLDALMRSTGRVAAREATPHLRRYAVQTGWPPAAARTLRVRYSDGELRVRYPDRLKAAVEDLEYGTEDQAPRPAIRRFTPRLGHFVNLSKILPSLDALFEGAA